MMKMNRAMVCAAAALGLALSLPSGASADETWQRYAPRCQPTELADAAASRDPCEAPLATFGLSGPTVLSHNDSVDVQTTGSIDSNARSTQTDARSPL
jgi:hypothetical protein